MIFACRAEADIVQFNVSAKRGIEIKDIIGVDSNIILTGGNQFPFVTEHGGKQGAIQRVDTLATVEQIFSLLEGLQKDRVKIVHSVNMNFVDAEIVIIFIFEVC